MPERSKSNLDIHFVIEEGLIWSRWLIVISPECSITIHGLWYTHMRVATAIQPSGLSTGVIILLCTRFSTSGQFKQGNRLSSRCSHRWYYYPRAARWPRSGHTLSIQIFCKNYGSVWREVRELSSYCDSAYCANSSSAVSLRPRASRLYR